MGVLSTSLTMLKHQKRLEQPEAPKQAPRPVPKRPNQPQGSLPARALLPLDLFVDTPVVVRLVILFMDQALHLLRFGMFWATYHLVAVSSSNLGLWTFVGMVLVLLVLGMVLYMDCNLCSPFRTDDVPTSKLVFNCLAAYVYGSASGVALFVSPWSVLSQAPFRPRYSYWKHVVILVVDCVGGTILLALGQLSPTLGFQFAPLRCDLDVVFVCRSGEPLPASCFPRGIVVAVLCLLVTNVVLTLGSMGIMARQQRFHARAAARGRVG